MSDNLPCPKCKSEFTYQDQDLMICSQCFHEWDPAEESVEVESLVKVLGSNEMN